MVSNFPLAEKKEDNSRQVTYSCSGWQGFNHIAAAHVMKMNYCMVRFLYNQNVKLMKETSQAQETLLHTLDVFELVVQVFHSLASRLMQKNTRNICVRDINEHSKLLFSLMIEFSLLTETRSYPFHLEQETI